MLKNLNEECLLNISSFLLGTPQQLKFKNSKALKQIQNKYKLDIETFKEIQSIQYDEDEDEPYRQTIYGYSIKNKNYTIEKAINIIKRQCHKLMSMRKPDGDIDLKLSFHFYVNNAHFEVFTYMIEDIDYTESEEDLLKYISIWTNKIMVNFENDYRHSEIQFKSVHFYLINRNYNIGN